MQVRVPTTIVSSICDDRGDEPTYNKVTMSTLITGDYNVGDVISLLWFKRQLPKYATRFIELVVMLCADHGPCVSGERSSCPPPSPPPASASPTFLSCSCLSSAYQAITPLLIPPRCHLFDPSSSPSLPPSMEAFVTRSTLSLLSFIL